MHAIANAFTCGQVGVYGKRVYTRSQTRLHAEANELTRDRKRIYTRRQTSLTNSGRRADLFTLRVDGAGAYGTLNVPKTFLLLLLLLFITHTKEERCNKRKINGYREGLREGNERQKREIRL